MYRELKKRQVVPQKHASVHYYNSPPPQNDVFLQSLDEKQVMVIQQKSENNMHLN